MESTAHWAYHDARGYCSSQYGKNRKPATQPAKLSEELGVSNDPNGISTTAPPELHSLNILIRSSQHCCASIFPPHSCSPQSACSQHGAHQTPFHPRNSPHQSQICPGRMEHPRPRTHREGRLHEELHLAEQRYFPQRSHTPLPSPPAPNIWTFNLGAGEIIAFSPPNGTKNTPTTSA